MLGINPFYMQNIQGQQPNMTAAPWGGLPTAQAPWQGGQTWSAAQQAPWRLSPWSTQGMPSGVEAQPPDPVPPTAYLGRGTSGGIPGFDPLQPGGGFYPQIIGGGAPQQQQGGGTTLAPIGWQSGGQVFNTRRQARQYAAQQQFADDSMEPGSTSYLPSPIGMTPAENIYGPRFR